MTNANEVTIEQVTGALAYTLYVADSPKSDSLSADRISQAMLDKELLSLLAKEFPEIHQPPISDALRAFLNDTWSRYFDLFGKLPGTNRRLLLAVSAGLRILQDQKGPDGRPLRSFTDSK